MERIPLTPKEAPEPVAPESKMTSVRLPKDLIKAAKLYALEHETSLGKLIEEGLKERIKR